MEDLLIERAEGFPEQHLYRLPGSALGRAVRQPFVRDFLVTDLGHFPSAPGHRVERPAGVDAHIVIHVVRGRGWCQLGRGRRRAVRAGEVIWIPPGLPHAYGAGAEEAWSLYWVHFRGTGAEQLLRWTPLRGRRGWCGQGPPLASVRRRFQAAFALVAAGYGRETLLGLSLFLVDWMALLRKRRPGEAVSRPRERMEAAAERMRERLAEHWTLEAYAREAGYSVAQFSKWFVRVHGMSPMKHLNELRMQRACEYLMGSDWSVKEIADRVGFEDAFYFSRVFKSATGLSPTAYRLEPKP